MKNTLLEHALSYARRGWHVFPVREKKGESYRKDGKTFTPLAKQPYVKYGLNASTTDEDVIRSWWKRYPNAGIGINCGASRLFVVDIDTKKGDGISNFMKLGISTDGALCSMTPSGGLHIIFSGVGKSTSSEERQIDTRSKGGYIIAPPSYILDKNGTKLYYSAIGDWDAKPVGVPPDLFKSLQIDKKRRPNPKYVNVNLDDKEIQKVRAAMLVLPVSLAHTHEVWFKIGASLKPLGELGFIMWEWWTKKYFEEKPNSTRRGTLRYKWDRLRDDGDVVGLGTLYFYAYQSDEAKNAKHNN